MKLHYGEPQIIIGLSMLVLTILMAAVFTIIALSSRRDVEFPRVQKVGYMLRRRWFFFLLAVAVIQVGVAFTLMPYSKADKGQAVVSVSGGQFYWTMDKTQIPVGTKVLFDVTSADVNHGFGLYDPDGVMIGTVQAMPGYHNRVEFDLDKKGKYEIWCLEYCGFGPDVNGKAVGHQTMMRTFEVVD